MLSNPGFRRAMFLLLLAMFIGLATAGKEWEKQDYHLHGNSLDEPKTQINRLDVVCSKDYMTVHMGFDLPFYGVVYSHAGHHQEKCYHVGPRAGLQEVSFHIKYDSCGTIEDLSGRFHENTIIIQYGEDILEAWDEAKRLRCEWLESFEKPSSKPTLAISDIDVVELNFQGDDIDCWMEVQEGKGPWARQVGGLVPIGSPLTLVIAINDHSREFDMRVKKCIASDGTGNDIVLTDETGCVLRPTLLTPFAKIRDFGGKATLVAYSHLFAFKFPDKLDVLVHCLVEVCRHGCPDSCNNNLLIDHHPYPREPFHSLESVKQTKLAEFAKAKQQIQAQTHSLHALESKKYEKVVELPKPKPPVLQPHTPPFPESKIPQKPEVIQPKPNHFPQSQEPHQRKRPLYLTKVPAHALKAAPGRQRNKDTLVTAEHNLHLISLNSSIAYPRGDTTLNLKKLLPDIEPSVIPYGKKIPKIPPVKNFKSEIVVDQSSKLDIKAAATNDAVNSVNPVSVGQYHRIIGHDAHWIDHHIPPLKEISNPPPQPEPSTWTADEVRPVVKERFPPHNPVLVKNENSKLKSNLQQLPKPLSYIPQPEPSVWSADDVTVLTKEEVFHQPNKQVIKQHYNNHHESLNREKLSTKSHKNDYFFPGSKEPKPEPAPWTYEEVHPMHKPGILSPHIEKERLEEPKPEPAPWTFDEVKPLTKDDLKSHSLNYKLKSHTHSDAGIPLYKESFHPHGGPTPSTFPEPVYVPRYTLPPMNNMSAPMMSKMMMMMPTLLPFTYQTARWPQRTTSRDIKQSKRQYPYPIPQFTHKQQMMMSVISDRRMDSDEDLIYEDNPVVKTNAGETDIGQAAANEKFTTKDQPETLYQTTKQPHDQMDKDQQINMADTKTSNNQPGEVFPAMRPPIAGFVPPSLDEGDPSLKSDAKDRTGYAPRALNRKKRSSEPIFGVKQRFQAIAPSDLAFEFNLTRENMAIFKGRREEIIYGVCMSPASMSASVGLILILTLLSIIASLVLYEHSWRLSNKTQHLSLLTRAFNGRFEALYRVPAQRHELTTRDLR